MKFFLCIPFLALNAICMLQAQAATCSPDKIQEIVEPASKQNPIVQIDCSVTLPKGAQVSKQLLFAGQQASGSVLDCGGAVIQALFTAPTVLITSLLKNGVWDVPQNIQIRNCKLKGSLRIHGMAANGQGEYLRESSIHEGHTARAQQAAPHHIVLDHVKINSKSNMLYIAPGVHYITVKNSSFTGKSRSSAIYMDAESANNTIENNTFNIQSRAQPIAIDGSAYNMIRGNTFINPTKGAIFLYRNCGEAGTIRHQTPSNNQIISNRFELTDTSTAPMIWVASRNGHKKYCDLDKGYPFGSSITNDDLAQNNVIADNVFILPKAIQPFSLSFPKKGDQNADKQDNLIRLDSTQPNQVSDNKIIN